MRKMIVTILFSLVLFSPVYTEKLHTFSDIAKPWKLKADKNYIYISDAVINSVFVFDLKNFKLVTKLGQKGEGPKELTSTPTMHLTSDRIYISDHTKFIAYSKKFEFLKEIIPGIWMPGNFPVEDHFAFTQSQTKANKNFTVLNLFNEKFEKIKQVTISPELKTKFLIFPTVISKSWKDKIYVKYADNNFFIEVFNKQGNKLYSIEKKLDKIKATEKHKKRYLEYILNFIGPKSFNKLKALKTFDKPLPKFLPDINDFWVIDHKIYVKTYDFEKDKDKYIILDIKGKILGNKYLPNASHQKFTFCNDKFYYLVDNEDGEGWELHMIEL